MIFVIVTVYTLFVLVSMCGFLTFAYPVLDNILYSIFNLQNLIPVESSLPDIAMEFMVVLIQAVGTVSYYALYFFFDFFRFVIAGLIKILPVLLKSLRIMISFCVWLVGNIWRGISGRDTPIFTSISWAFIFCSFVLYLERFLHRQPPLDEVQNNGRRNTNNSPNTDQQNLVHNFHRRSNEQNTEPSSPTNYEDIQASNQNTQNLELENQTIRSRNNSTGDNLCIVCLENEKTIAVFPCGHMQFCLSCVQAIMRGRKLCPLCQGRIQEHRRVYV